MIFVSVQFLLESSAQAHKQVNFCVSDYGNILVVIKPLSRCIYNENLAIMTPRFSNLTDTCDDRKCVLGKFLSHHTQVVAQKSSIKKLEEKTGLPADEIEK